MIKFFEYFTLENFQNQEEIFHNLECFYDFFKKFDLTKIFINTLPCIKGNKKKSNDFTKKILKSFEVSFLKENFDLTVNDVNIQIACLKILKSLIFDKFKNEITENQSKIISIILKNPNSFMQILTDNANFIEIRDDIMKEIEIVKKSKGIKNIFKTKEFQFINLHNEFIQFFACLCINNGFSSLQIQKLFACEQIKILLESNDTPFIFKTPYLRIFFQVIIFLIKVFIFIEIIFKLVNN